MLNPQSKIPKLKGNSEDKHKISLPTIHESPSGILRKDRDNAISQLSSIQADILRKDNKTSLDNTIPTRHYNGGSSHNNSINTRLGKISNIMNSQIRHQPMLVPTYLMKRESNPLDGLALR